MPGDEDKKKKKKSKKSEEAAPEPEPAPPAQEESSFFGDDDGGDDWLSGAVEDTSGGEAQAPAGAMDEPPMEFPAQEEGGFDFGEGEGDFLPEGEEGVELPPQPKQKPKYFVHWDRRKAKFYDYNYDYGTNYYGSMVRYCDTKNAGHPEVPRRMAFAERGMVSSLERHRNPDQRTQNLLNDIRSNIRNFENSQRLYAYGKRI